MALERIQITDAVLFGRKIVEWALSTTPRPNTADEFRTALADIAIIPDRITSVQFSQSPDPSILIVRLPNKTLLRESLARVQHAGGDYPVPLFYFDKICGGGNPLSNEDFLFARISDYSVAECM